ncbi:MAG: hypothetical protein CSB55_00465 [Candidatus Cloacimonadota bacterium]|nr:MAG: hypothetical protein CSB55_00465 [Candidatus Cloacimonadota bacterium]
MEKRNRLINIALKEAELNIRIKNPPNSGEEIEKYLSPFRSEFNRMDKTNYYSDKKIGFAWCAAFVFWCCRQAGFEIPLHPSTSKWTMAYVKTWYEFASSLGLWAEESEKDILPGDSVVFRKLESESEFCHIGIVKEIFPDRLITVEGNLLLEKKENFTVKTVGVKERKRNENIKGFIRLDEKKIGN